MHSKTTRSTFGWIAGALTLALVMFLAAPPALAQTSSGTLRGIVTDKEAPVPGATVVAVNVQTGFQYPVLTQPNGSYNLVVAPGLYDIKVSAESYRSLTKRLDVLIGQTLTVNFKLQGDNLVVENVTVVGTRVTETRTPEVATNVTDQQIEALPQGSRNFLNFATLAPGVRTPDNTDDPRASQATFRSGGQDSRQVNAYIDGVSYKNDILPGGAFVQNSSRGNPFPQSAVQEFRVLTSNYKSEYDKAAAAIITAVTKSGGNQFSGDVALFYQGKNMVTQDIDSRKQGLEKPDYKRWQGALTLGGPIIKDQLHFFTTYEQNDQDRFNLVQLGRPLSSIPTDLQPIFASKETGNIAAPFRSKLFFGKLNYQPATTQTLEVSASIRDEYERKDFGGQRTFDGATDFQVNSGVFAAKHQWILSGWINEATLSYQRQQWKPTALNTDTVEQNYFGILDFGGRSTTQDYKQDRIALRDDLSHTFNWIGRHAVKAGASVDFVKYDIDNSLDGNPRFNYRQEDNWAQPFEAFYGFGDPKVKFNNKQFGVYVQDDWAIAPNFEVNAGIRWNYETDMLNNDYRTPAALLNSLETSTGTFGGTTYHIGDWLDLNKYTTDGSRRNAYKGMFQPRLGFSWDVMSNGKTVVFGGVGRYFDRVNLSDIYEEEHKQTWKTYHFCFNAAACGNPAIAWDPSLLSKAGLAAAIANGTAPGPETWLLANDTKPPYTDQWTLGVRQAIGQWQYTVSYNNVRGYNGLTWFFGDRYPGATSQWGDNISIQGYGRILVSDTSRRTWYDGWFLTIDKPYTAASKWGLNVAYTYSSSSQYGRENQIDGTAFGFDYITPANFKRERGNYDEKNRLVVSGQVGLPFDIQFTSILTLGSGIPFTIYDASAGWDHFQNRWNAGSQPGSKFLGFGEWAYRNIDTRLSKQIGLGRGQSVTLMVEAFNIFNYDNRNGFGWSEGFIGPDGVKDPKFGYGYYQVNPRRWQMGAKYSF